MSWTDDRIAALTKMWKEGKSAADIAKTLGKGVTRNAVIGKAHRLGLSGRPSPIKASGGKEPARKESASVKSAPVRRTKAAPATAEDTQVSKPARAAKPAVKAETRSGTPRPGAIIVNDVAPPGGGLPLLELTERMCKWPFGDPRDDDFSFCGATVRPGTPYCPGHAALACQASARGRAAAAAASRATAAEEEEPGAAVEEEQDEEEEGAVA